jgi:hypothetical protein
MGWEGALSGCAWQPPSMAPRDLVVKAIEPLTTAAIGDGDLLADRADRPLGAKQIFQLGRHRLKPAAAQREHASNA